MEGNQLEIAERPLELADLDGITSDIDADNGLRHNIGGFAAGAPAPPGRPGGGILLRKVYDFAARPSQARPCTRRSLTLHLDNIEYDRAKSILFHPKIENLPLVGVAGAGIQHGNDVHLGFPHRPSGPDIEYLVVLGEQILELKGTAGHA